MKKSNVNMRKNVHISSSKNLVATDVALANIKEIERNELITEWIENGILCTPPISENNTTSSINSSPIFQSFEKEADYNDSNYVLTTNIEKSPILNKKYKKNLNNIKSFDNELDHISHKSPIIGKKRRYVSSSNDKTRVTNSSNKRKKFNQSMNSSDLEKSPILVKRHKNSHKKKAKNKPKKLLDTLDLDNNSPNNNSHSNKNDQSVQSHCTDKTGVRKPKEFIMEEINIQIKEEITEKLESGKQSQEIIDDEEIITASPITGTKTFIGDFHRLPIIKIEKEEEEEEDFFCSYGEVKVKLEDHEDHFGGDRIELNRSIVIDESHSSPGTGFGIKLIKSSRRLDFDIPKDQERSLDGSTVIQDTEEFFPRTKALQKRIRIVASVDKNVPKEARKEKTDDKFLILDSEFGIEKRKFVTDTERIDYDDSNSENNDENDNDNGEGFRINEKVITGVDSPSESDKTVSDIIEEPITQDCRESLKSKELITADEASIPCESTSNVSRRISDLISSQKDSIPTDISAVDITVGSNTPPGTQESITYAPEVFDSGKKKKSRRKKGSLSARLQKLITGQVSSVRLWRHQISQESTLERSSAPCIKLLVTDTWIEYGKNLCKSKIMEDRYDLLKDYFYGTNGFGSKGGNGNRNRNDNLVVMTNPDFVGSVKILPGNFLNIYLPWEIFNANSVRGYLVLHALYFCIVPNPGKNKVLLNNDGFQVSKDSGEIRDYKIIREYDCPCLKNGKIHDSCLNKFTDHKIDVIDEIIK